MAKRGPKKPLTKEHKAAMAEGRRDSNAVKAYLAAVRAASRSKTSPRPPEELTERINMIGGLLDQDLDPLSEIKLRQERRDLRRELEEATPESQLRQLETDFVRSAARYSERNGIDFETWREAGISVDILKRAKIST